MKVNVISEGLTVEPFNKSLLSTFVKEVPPVKLFTGDPASFTARITGAVTGRGYVQ